MKRFIILSCVSVLLASPLPASAQRIEDLERAWQETIDALNRGDQDRARQLFESFNQKVREHVRDSGLSWQVEYLAGSLDCRFADTRSVGAKLLKEVLQNSRDLNGEGQAEVKRQLDACTAPMDRGQRRAPQVVPATTSVAHFQSPGVHGDMKGGSRHRTESETGLTVSPKSSTELLARRVPLSEPRKALDAALGRLPRGATGAIVGNFVVTTARGDESRAIGIGQCLTQYLPPLQEQFGIEGPQHVVTVYSAESTADVYSFAKSIHGLTLPAGVIAYSVSDDMSLAGTAEPSSCGSMAHELVHLLIKRTLPLSPPWLEEGLASEVAVASPTERAFVFNRSWRDDFLQETRGIRPQVAELLDMPWSALNGKSGFFMQEQAIAAQAMAAVFIRFLDAQGKLRQVYFDVRNREFSSDVSSYMSYAEIVEKHLGRSITDVDRAFDTWFDKTLHR